MKKIRIILFLAVLCAFDTVLAQEMAVSGRVTDRTDRLPLPGLSVLVCGLCHRNTESRWPNGD